MHFQTFLVKVLASTASIGMTEEYLLLQARQQISDRITLEVLQVQLDEMKARDLAISVPSLIGPKRWRITGLGASVAQEARL
jgi:hypothetical protein